jgi:tetratricopeptide (TPR) repeat protein
VARVIILACATAIAFAMEAGSAVLLWKDNTSVGLAHSLWAHAVGASMLAFVIWEIVRSRMPSARLWAAALVCLFTPWLSAPVALGFALGLCFARDQSDEAKPMLFEPVKLPGEPDARLMSALARSSGDLYDEAGLGAVLRWSTDRDRRYRAVLRAQRLRDRESVRILQLALRDQDDEIRLLAYSLLEKREQALAERIRARQNDLENLKSAEDAAFIHWAMAHDCWELVHLGLMQGEVSAHFLKMSRRHLEEAIRISPTRAGPHFLLGRVLLRLGEWEAAVAAFLEAERKGLGAGVADAYLREAKFALMPATEDDAGEPSIVRAMRAMARAARAA